MRQRSGWYKFWRGACQFVGTGPTAYLWFKDSEGQCVGWLESHQLDAICEEWQKRKAHKGAKAHGGAASGEAP